MRAIDGDALINELNNSHYPGAPYIDAGISIAIGKVCDAPTIEPERKTGKWVLHENQRQEDVDNGNYLYVCSECGKSDLHAKTQEVPFCWWCGSEMREGEQE